MKPRRLFSSARLSFPLATALVLSHAQAQTSTWVGGYAATSTWSQASQWAEGAFTNNDNVIFTDVVGVSTTATFLGSARTVNSINFVGSVSGTDPAFSIRLSDSNADTNAINLTFRAGNLGINVASTDSANHFIGTDGAGTFGNIVLLDSMRVTHNGSGTLTLNRPITGAYSLFKSGSGTLVLSGANTYSVGTNVNGGTLTLNRQTGSLAATTLTFSGTGTFNMDNTGATAALTQTLGALAFTAGEGTVKTTRTAAQSQLLTFASLAARSAGASGNFVPGGGTNSTTNGFNFTAAPTAGTLIDRGIFYNGASYATYDAGGFVRGFTTGDTGYLAAPTAANIGASTDTSNVDLTTGAITAQTTISANTLNLRGNSLTLSDTAQILSVNGILSAGSTSAQIATVGKLQATALGGEIVVRVDGATDRLTINPIIRNFGVDTLGTASGLTKSGIGTLNLTGANTYTGATVVNAGTLVLNAANNISSSSGLTLASGTTLQLRNDNDTVFTTPINTPSAGTSVIYNFDVNRAASGTGKTMTLGAITFAGSTSNQINVTGGNSYALSLGAITSLISNNVPNTTTFNAISAPLTIASYAGGSYLQSFLFQGGNSITVNGAIAVAAGSNGSIETEILGGTTVTFKNAQNLQGGTGTATNTLTNGTLNINHVSALGSISGKSTLNITAGTIDNTSGAAITAQNGNPVQNWNGDFTFTGTNGALSDLNLGTGLVTLGTAAGTARQVTVTNAATTLTIGGVIDDGTTATSLTKVGPGTLRLTGMSATAASNYSGTTTIGRGTLAFANTDPLFTGGLTFGSGAGSSAVGALDLSAASATFGGAFIVRTDSATANAISIGSGKTLLLNASVTVGYNSSSNSTTKLDVTGLGTLSIGTNLAATDANVQIGSGTTTNISNAATVDLSGLSTFYSNLGTGTFRVGSPTNSNGTSAAGSTLVLADDSTIQAATLVLGSPDNGVTQSLKLGSGTNVINVGTLNIGGIGAADGRSSGSLTFNGATGTLKIRSQADPVNGRATLNVASVNMGTNANQTGNLFDTTGHSADLRFGTMTIGSRTDFGGTTTGEFKFDAGTLNANDLIAGNRGGTAAAATTTGIVTLGGGTVTFNNTTGPIQLGVNSVNNGTAAGTLNVSGGAVSVAANGGNSIRLGNASVASGTATGTVNLTGGTLTVAGDIIRGATTGTSNANVKISGGILDMGGHDLGATGTGVITLTSEAGELKNVATINGSGGITKTSVGSLILSGTNGYTGATAINEGVLNIRSNTATGTTAGGVTVASGAALEIQGGITVGAEALGLNGTGIASNGALRNISGTNVWQGAVTLNGATTIQSDLGTLTFNTATTSITGIDTNLVIEGAGAVTISGATEGLAIGSGTLTKNDGGTLTLTGPSSYTGATNITGGVLNIRNATSLGTIAGGVAVSSGAALQIQGGITVGAEALDLNGTGITSNGALRNISGTNVWQGAVTLGSASRINSDAGTLTLSGGITGTGLGLTVGGAGNTTISSTGINTSTGGTLTKDGSGTLTLSTSSNFTGNLTVKAGTVTSIATTNSVFGGGTITIDTGGAVNATVQTGDSDTGRDFANPITVVAGSIGTNTLGATTNSTTYSGLITANENLTINRGGSTTLAVFGGGGSVASGKIITLQNASTGIINANGIVTGDGGVTTAGAGLGTINITGASTYTGGFTLGGSSTVVIATSSTGTAGNPTNGAFGAGSTASTLGAGTIRAAAAGSDITVANTLNLTGNVTTGTSITDERSLTFTGPATLTGTRTFTTALGGTVAGKRLTFSGAIGESSPGFGITKAGAGLMVLSGANTYTGTTTVNGGILNLGVAENVNVSGPLGKQLANAVGTIVFGGGTLQHSAANQFDYSGRFSTAASQFYKVDTNGQNVIWGTDLTSSGGKLAKFGAGTLTLSGTNTYTGTTSIAGGVTSIVVVNNASALGVGGDITYDGNGIIRYTAASASQDYSARFKNSAFAIGIDSNGQNVVFADIIDSTNDNGFIKYGLGSVTFGNANTYNGNTTITQGVLKVGAGGAIPSGTGKGNVAFNTAANSAILDINGFDTTINGLSQANASTTNMVVNNAVGTDKILTVGSNDATTTFAGIIADNTGTGGTLALTKTGSGILTLAGTNSHSGTTTISAGTLVLSNANAAGTGGIALSGANAVLQIASGITLANATNDITVSNATASVVRAVAASAAYNTGTIGDLASDLGAIDTTAQILAGTNSAGSDATLTMKFSDTNLAGNDAIRRSDVFSVSGTTGTDAYVLQLTASGLAADSVLGYSDGSLWNLAVTGNTGAGSLAGYYASSWSSFFSANGGILNADMLGAHGYDSGGTSVWAVVNYGSVGGGGFAAVPEPTSALVGLLIGAGLLRRRRGKNVEC